MKKTILMMAIVMMSSHVFSQEEKKINLDDNTTIIKWIGRKLVGEHNGKIKVKSGTVEMKGNKVMDADITVDMNSITCDDIENKDKNKYLVSHLKNDDFFATEKFPTAHLKIIERNKKNNNLKANLTIKGKTHPVSFRYKINEKAKNKVVSTTIKFDRTKYGIVYNSSLTEKAKDKMIDDIVELQISFPVNY